MRWISLCLTFVGFLGTTAAAQEKKEAKHSGKPLNSVLGGEAGTASMRVRPIQIVSSDNMPGGLPVGMLPTEPDMMIDQPSNGGAGFIVYYLVEGRDIDRFDSLTVNAIRTREGIDLSKH